MKINFTLCTFGHVYKICTNKKFPTEGSCPPYITGEDEYKGRVCLISTNISYTCMQFIIKVMITVILHTCFNACSYNIATLAKVDPDKLALCYIKRRKMNKEKIENINSC